MSTAHIPDNVRIAPTFTPEVMTWLFDRDIYDCLHIVHDAMYPAAALQANYHARHHPILNASLVTLLALDLPQAAPTRHGCMGVKNTRDRPYFTTCCAGGQVSLAPRPTPPTALLQLYTGQHAEAKTFRQELRSLNTNFQFTSCGARLDPT